MKVRYTQFSARDAEKAIKLTDEEIAEYYERNKPKYAGTNSVAPTLEAVKADVRKDLLASRADRAAADRATEFAVRLVPKPGAARPAFTAVCTEFGVKPLDSVTMVVAPLSLLFVAAIACLFPAWRASQADPAVALHHD